MNIFSKIISAKGTKPVLFKREKKRVVEDNNQPLQTSLKDCK